MSSGTGRATSQNSGIDWKDNLVTPVEERATTDCHLERNEDLGVCHQAVALMAWARTESPRFTRDDNPFGNSYSVAFFGGSIPKYFITICKSFQASPF